jgi:hypothetical protein
MASEVVEKVPTWARQVSAQRRRLRFHAKEPRAIQDATDHLEQRRRRVRKVAQRVSAGKGWIKMASAGGATQGTWVSQRNCVSPLRGSTAFLRFTQGFALGYPRDAPTALSDSG